MIKKPNIRALRDKRTGLWRHELIRGEAVTIGTTTITPIARRISLGLTQYLASPDKGFTLIFQRPEALIVKKGASTRTVRIHDVQQIIIFTLFVISAICLYIFTRPDQNRRGLRNSKNTP